MNRVKQTDEDKIRLPQRSFLLLIALFTSTILLTACQHTPSPAVLPPTGTPLPVATRTATLTQTSTLIPTPTRTATVTPTPTPAVRAEPWERSREDQDKTLAQLMFAYIGGVNHVNRNGLDMKFGDINIASPGSDAPASLPFFPNALR